MDLKRTEDSRPTWVQVLDDDRHFPEFEASETQNDGSTNRGTSAGELGIG